MVGVEGVAQAQGVGEHPGADPERSRVREPVVPVGRGEQEGEAGDVQGHDNGDHGAHPPPLGRAQARQDARDGHLGSLAQMRSARNKARPHPVARRTVQPDPGVWASRKDRIRSRVSS